MHPNPQTPGVQASESQQSWIKAQNNEKHCLSLGAQLDSGGTAVRFWSRNQTTDEILQMRLRQILLDPTSCQGKWRSATLCFYVCIRRKIASASTLWSAGSKQVHVCSIPCTVSMFLLFWMQLSRSQRTKRCWVKSDHFNTPVDRSCFFYTYKSISAFFI